MARIPPPLLKLLAETLHDDERVIWQGRPDAWTDMMMLRFLWWIGVPWLTLAVVATHRGWIDESAFFFLITGVVMLAGPVMLYIRDLQTLFVITDRRALILRTAMGQQESLSTAPTTSEMDKELEILPISGHVGHLNFASGVSTRTPDTDYTGRYGFRCVKNVEKVRDCWQARREIRLRHQAFPRFEDIAARSLSVADCRGFPPLLQASFKRESRP